MENISEVLKKTRESKNLSLEEVSKATKIRLNVLKAIEDGNFNLLSKVYMYSFLREYINFLGLNFNDYREQIEKFFQKQNIEEREPDELAFYHPFQKKKKVRYTAAQLNKALYFIYAAIFLSFVAIFYFTIFYETEEQKSIETSKTADTVVIKEEPKAQNIFQPVQDSIKLEFFAIDTVWINVVIDNKISEKLVLYPNQTKIWSASNFFRFTLGNAGGVIIKRDGVELPRLSREKVAIKNIIVTRDKYYVEQPQRPKTLQEPKREPIILTPSEIKREIPSLRDTQKAIPN